ncbi:MAG: VWA domain-containing protein [Clostridia bacterium]|nr:VWA domain-containing protein [Clostridia bacterium]
MKNRIIALLLALMLIFSLLSCAKAEEGITTDGKTPSEAPSSHGKDSSEEAENDLIYEGLSDMEVSDDMSLEVESFSSSVDVDGGALKETAGSDPAEGTADTEGTPAIEEIIEHGTLTAGEWKDNDNYEFWKSLFEREDWQEFARNWQMIPNMRFAVTLTNGQNAAKNVRVEMYAGEHLMASAVSDSYGKAYLSPHLLTKTPTGDLVGADRLVVYSGAEAKEYPITPDHLAAGGMSVNDVAGEKYNALDLMFVIDTTGSMGDELEYLKKELGNVISTVSEENDGLDISLSLNFYRDEGDEYVVRSNPFSKDIEASLKALDNEYSDGGGDYPEAVDAALNDALSAHDWRDGSVKLLFLVLDAPPHRDNEESVKSIGESIAEAAKTGVRIIPIASSGIDTETEFLLRIMSLASGGTYTFLTDHSGVGEAHLEPTIGDYNVKKLNDLLVKIINEYCK